MNRVSASLAWLSNAPMTLQNPENSDNFMDWRTSNDTWVSIEYNAGLAGVAAALNEAKTSYDQCLQGFGIFSTEGAICDNNSNTASNKRR